MMKNILLSVRTFLDKNKVFLDTTLTIALIFLAFKANQISNRQKEMEYIDKQPKFYIKVEKSSPDTDFDKRERQLLFYNIDGHYENFDETTIVKYLIEYSDSSGLNKKKIFYINGFFNSEFPGEGKQGVIRTLYGYKNESKLYEKEEVLRSLRDSLVFDYCNTSFYTFSRISFINSFGDKVVKYYNTSFREGMLLSDERGKDIFDEYYKEKYKLVEFDSIDRDFYISALTK